MTIVPIEKHRDDGSARIRLVPFDDIRLSKRRRDLVRGIIPRVGLAVVWGKPKCGKSFWLFDCLMHPALNREYRGRRVQPGAVVYCAFEGQSGLEARVEAFRLHRMYNHAGAVPFYLQPVTLNLVKDHRVLIKVIRDQLGDVPPIAVALDTLNRSMPGSESSDEDMSAYVKAADAIREAFECAVVIVHHCGVEGTRPRGHTSLSGAVEAQIEVKRDASDRIVVEVELAKDGPQGAQIVSTLEAVVVGQDEDGEDITSCVICPCEDIPQPAKAGEPKLSANQRVMFRLLHQAGAGGLTVEDWNEQPRALDIGKSRKATLWELRCALKDKGLVREYAGRWTVAHE